MMFTREINGALYMLVKVPDGSTGISFFFKKEDNMPYIWISNDAGISKRVEMSLDLWSKVGMMNDLPEVPAMMIGLAELDDFLAESGLKKSNALLFVYDELKGLAPKRPWEK